jgi:ubiquinone/menaquinone biosynthesis C-methylase UbiE
MSSILRNPDRALQAILARHDYNTFHALTAMTYQAVTDKSVLVVGCNRGEDCRYFAEAGAARVIGLDVMDEIGVSFTHPCTTYTKASAEKMPFEDGEFDLVYCFATLEHVPDIFAAMREMGRVCKEGGLIYSLAAPLWNVIEGPHWDRAFADKPWIHLRMTVEEIIAYSEQRRATNPSAQYFSPGEIAFYMNEIYFNKRPARDYLAAARAVPGLKFHSQRNSATRSQWRRRTGHRRHHCRHGLSR